jgi:hypothetical protein
MLLRNIDPSKLCNGSRLIKQMNNNVIEATILIGQAKIQVFPFRDPPYTFRLFNQFEAATVSPLPLLCNDDQQSSGTISQSCGLKPGICLLFKWTVLCWLFPGQFNT